MGKGSAVDAFVKTATIGVALVGGLFLAGRLVEPSYMAWKCESNLQSDLTFFLDSAKDAKVEKCAGRWTDATCLVRWLEPDGTYKTRPWRLKCSSRHFTGQISSRDGVMTDSEMRSTVRFFEDLKESPISPPSTASY